MSTMPVSSVYSLEQELKTFFSKVSVTLADCDEKAVELVGGKVVPVEIQGVCSYTVFAGQSQDKVVQFRLKSLALPLETVTLAKQIYGSFAPAVTLHGTFGRGTEGEDVLVYVLERIQGVTRLDFIISCSLSEESEEYKQLRRNLLTDLGRFFAISWNAPQSLSDERRRKLKATYTKELQLLVDALPSSFHPAIHRCVEQIDAIMALPMVLLHRDFGDANVIVSKDSYHLTGVVDWAEAEICPFGQNLYRLEHFMGKLHLKLGWQQLSDHEALVRAFWSAFQKDALGMNAEILRTIKDARVMGLLLSKGFTKRLANMPPPVPVDDDAAGDYNKRYMHGLLIDEDTRFEWGR